MKEKSNVNNHTPLHMALVASFFILWTTLYHEAVLSAAKVWLASETYKHCFLIIPGAVYLIWLRRFDIVTSKISPTLLAILPLIGVSAIGILGRVGDIQLFTHFAAFTSIPLCIWLCLGHRASIKILFPLCFMLAAIPIGEELVPVLQEVTADIAMALLKLTGLPVFRNGLYIEIPAGRFVVAEACSGIRFFISTLVFSAIYAYLSFHSLKRQLTFFAIAAFIPILANAVRVFGIIMVGHFFGMEHASGTDHLVYGWAFFCIVLFLLFGFGEFFRKISNRKTQALLSDTNPLDNVPSETTLNVSQLLSKIKKGLVTSLAVLASVQLWVFYISTDGTQYSQKLNPISLPPMIENNASTLSWSPIYEDANDKGRWQFTYSDTAVETFIAWYPSSSAEHELISSKNRLFNPKSWSIIDNSQIALRHENEKFNVNLTIITNPMGAKRAVVHWYYVEGQVFSGATKTKIMQAIKKMLGGSDAGAFIAFSSLIEEANQDTINLLTQAIEHNVNEVFKSIPSATQ